MSEQLPEIPTCGRPTKSGQPCKARISRFEVACKAHATQHDHELAQTYQRGYREGFDRGREIQSGGAKLQVEHLERRVRELEQLLDDATRIYEIGGDQVVEVGKYAYRWRGEPSLKVGERVLLPENWVSRLKDGPGTALGVVTKLGTTYLGEMSLIVGRAPAATA
jgi:hypothetical protein